MQPQPEFNSYKNNSNSKSKTATPTNTKQQHYKYLSEESTTASKLQQQQHKSHKQQAEHQQILRTTTKATATTATITTATTKTSSYLRPRVIKSNKPLVNFRFYLDIHDHQLTKHIEKQIGLLGGTQEFFLDANITHFITDKVELPANVVNRYNNTTTWPTTPKTPSTPITPQTPVNQPNTLHDLLESKNASATKSNAHKVAQSRADAILSRVRQQGTISVSSPIRQTPNTSGINHKKVNNSYTIWQTDYALRFFKKVQYELKAFLQPVNKLVQQNQIHNKSNIKTPLTSIVTNSLNSTADIITLKGGFIKFESIKRSCRPYYQKFCAPWADWPKISLNSDEGAFRLTAEKSFAMTRKSRSRSSQCGTPLEVSVPPLKKTVNNTTAPTGTVGAAINAKKQSQCRQLRDSTDQQCGVCEICKVEYDTLTIHLKTKDHEFFARNAQNFIALDTLIKTSADVNKFLVDQVSNNNGDGMNKVVHEEMVEMEVDVEKNHMSQVDVNVADPLEQPIEIHNLSPPLRERSKRSTKGKHSSEKFQNKRTRISNTTAKTKTTTTTRKISPLKTPPNTLEITPTKNIMNTNNNNTNSSNNNNNNNTRSKSNAKANLSSPVRPFPPPSSLYKVVETSQIENTPKRIGIAGRLNENVTASPSLIVKIKKVRNNELVRLNGEAESFMFPKTQRRASSDLPTDVDRHSSSERLRTSIYSSSSLDSSCISDIVVNFESPEPLGTTTTATTTLSRAQLARKKNCQYAPNRSFQNAPIQPDLQQTRLRKSSTTNTPVAKATQRPQKANSKIENVAITELSPPSAAAAIVAATAKITLPAATRKSSRMATAIVSAATISSRLLRAAAEVVKKSGKCAQIKAKEDLIKNMKKDEQDEINAETETGTLAMVTTMTSTPINRIRSCRLSANSTVVKLEDRMGDDSSTMNTDDEHVIDNFNTSVVKPEKSVVEVTRTRRRSRQVMNLDMEALTTTITTPATATIKMEPNDEADDDYDDIDNDDVADKDFKYKLKKCTKKAYRKPRSRRGKRRKLNAKITTKIDDTSGTCKQKQTKNMNERETKGPKSKKVLTYYDYTKSERIQQQNYVFERIPQRDLWYRVFTRQDNCEEGFCEYFGSTKYHKLPYELGPIPYNRTKIKINCCKLCHTDEECDKVQHVGQDVNIKTHITPVTNEMTEKLSAITTTTTTSPTLTPTATTTTTPTPYALKHKKLHLLQRYRQEQEALQQQEQQKLEEEEEKIKQQENCHLKAESLAHEIANGIQSDMERRRERAGSIHSTSSSCASSNMTMKHAKKTAFRNKLLSKAAFLSSEMPPRKSPREHASTLALVSIIKQRQESKPNSDAEDIHSVPTTPTPKEEILITTPIVTPLPANIHNTRSAAATPIEEMCFATEISENVKRMRRGRNKYDHSPPYVVNNARRLARQKINKCILETIAHETPQEEREVVEKIPVITKPHREHILNPSLEKRHVTTTATMHVCNLHSKVYNLPPSVRKTGQKKGVLEFAVDEIAINDLDAALKSTPSVRQLEREIDDFLNSTGKDLDIDELLVFDSNKATTETDMEMEIVNELIEECVTKEEQEGTEPSGELVLNTPPATEYFSSDFDLCDLLHEAQNTILGGDEAKKRNHETKHISLYNTLALNKYFRKRKYMKCNRTGWPKLQKKKYSIRQQTLIAKEKAKSKEIVKAVITTTPPNSEGDALLEKTKTEEIVQPVDGIEAGESTNEVSELKVKDDEESDCETFYDGAESIPEDEYTVVDSLVEDIEDEEEEEVDANMVTKQLDEYEKAVEADDEDEFNDALEGEIDENTMSDTKAVFKDEVKERDRNQQAHIDLEQNEDVDEDVDDCVSKSKRRRNNSYLAHCFNSLENTKVADEEEDIDVNLDADVDEDMNCLNATTSTPTKSVTRSLRHTPQLNGSLVSCNSPSERAGDNSDIFTVSSDGLDTDMDISNPHSHSKDEQQQNGRINSRNNSNKSNKYDITKYVKNPTANTCAAEAATAAAKSLAIAQFLKKEVRVSCRRIRAPFRRFRYRR